MPDRTTPLTATATRVLRPTGGLTWQRIHKNLFARLLAAFLVVSVPAIAVLGIVLSSQESAALTGDATAAAVNVSRAATSKVEAWLESRNIDLENFAQLLGGSASDPRLAQRLSGLIRPHPADMYEVIEVTDPTGRVLAASSTQL